VDLGRPYGLGQAGAFFVTRAKSKLNFRRVYSQQVDKATRLLCDQTVCLAGPKSIRQHSDQLRRASTGTRNWAKRLYF
jgi:hypothetical protein